MKLVDIISIITKSNKNDWLEIIKAESIPKYPSIENESYFNTEEVKSYIFKDDVSLIFKVYNNRTGDIGYIKQYYPWFNNLNLIKNYKYDNYVINIIYNGNVVFTTEIFGFDESKLYFPKPEYGTTDVYDYNLNLAKIINSYRNNFSATYPDDLFDFYVKEAGFKII